MRRGGTAIALTLLMLGLLGCDDDSDRSNSTPGADQPVATATNAETASPDPPLQVDLFDDPRESVVTRTVALSDAGDLITFAPWDGESVMLYDASTGDEIDLDPGRFGVFSPDSRYMAWIASGALDSFAGEGWVIDLRTRERTSLGDTRTLRFMTDGRLAIGVGASDAEALDLATGERVPVDGATAFNPPFPRTTLDGYVLTQAGAADPNGGGYSSRWTLRDAASRDLLEFDALHATAAGRGWLAAATAPRLQGATAEGQFDRGTVNVFLIEIATGRAEFIATSVWSYANWPLVANERYVVWTEDFCGLPSAGRTRVYDRASKEIVELDQSLWLEALTDEGTLAVGAFGANELIDIDSLAYTVRLPEGVGDNAWSPDYRWASVGRSLGHGGLCP